MRGATLIDLAERLSSCIVAIVGACVRGVLTVFLLGGAVFLLALLAVPIGAAVGLAGLLIVAAGLLMGVIGLLSLLIARWPAGTALAVSLAGFCAVFVHLSRL